MPEDYDTVVSQKVNLVHLITGLFPGLVAGWSCHVLLSWALPALGELVTVGIGGVLGGIITIYFTWHYENPVTGVRLIDEYEGEKNA